MSHNTAIRGGFCSNNDNCNQFSGDDPGNVSADWNDQLWFGSKSNCLQMCLLSWTELEYLLNTNHAILINAFVQYNDMII